MKIICTHTHRYTYRAIARPKKKRHATILATLATVRMRNARIQLFGQLFMHACVYVV